jgi:hypothetical protein
MMMLFDDAADPNNKQLSSSSSSRDHDGDYSSETMREQNGEILVLLFFLNARLLHTGSFILDLSNKRPRLTVV